MSTIPTFNKFARQGDVLIQHIPEDSIDLSKATRIDNTVLAYGEVTGHKHEVVPIETDNNNAIIGENKAAELFRLDNSGTLYLRVNARARLQHEEHGAIIFKQGLYRIDIQQEYTPSGFRSVAD
ncbi:hypothetical protein [Microcystis phage LMM01]|jgi:hypothetical protein|uniref:Uncharacterized protein n=1 Tax=Microcystis phage LMM01 TaxID=2856824 RepID=A0A7T9_9CAUD|nr:hypothetical protein MaLMM01_gp175 [Microcystis phage LMM01]BAF36266.1 hypothetical protein [Microcystis phage LMM01]